MDIPEKIFYGHIFDIKLELPVERLTVRRIVESKNIYAHVLVKRNDITIYQAHNDLKDELENFLKKMPDDEQIKFMELYIEEINAVTNAINDETNKINNEILESQNSASAIVGIICLVVILIVMFIFLAR